ncbi:hypothetical protein A4G19_00645 [Pasteurellaceae bacterium Macca]|nr:hypothetical protein [Pasteurellaceae bacterium Macca]
MNKVFKVIFNTSLNVWVAVSELSKAHKKQSNSNGSNHNLSIGISIIGSILISSPIQAAFVYGDSAQAKSNAIAAIGTNANAEGSQSLALGENTFAVEHSIAIGALSRANKSDSVAIGVRAEASNGNSNAIGDTAKAIGSFSTSIGTRSMSTDYLGTAIAAHAEAIGVQSTSIGSHASAKGRSATAIGAQSKALHDRAIALGNNANASGEYSTAIGLSSEASQFSSIALGAFSKSYKKQASAIGYNVIVEGEQSVALGSNINIKTANSVVLGSSSTTAGSHPTQTVSETTISGITYKGFQGSVTDNGYYVSIGAVGKERQLKNVAAGNISSSSTDGINGSQLYAVAEYAARGWKITTSKSAGNVVGTSPTTVKMDETVTVDAGNNINITQAGRKITIATTTTPTFKSVTTDNLTVKPNGNIQLSNNQIHGVAAGTNDTDAVNFSQLKATRTVVTNGTNAYVRPQANTTSGGTDYIVEAEKSVVNNSTNANISITPNRDEANHTTTYTADLTDTTKKDIKQGVDANTTANLGLDFAGDTGKFNRKLGRVTNVTGGATGDVTTAKNIKVTAKDGTLQIDLAKNIDLGNDGSIQVGGTTINATTFDAGNKKITNVEPAELSANSKDAVNGSQLHSTNLNLTNLTNKVDGGFNVTTAKTGTGVADRSSTAPVHLGETVKYTAGNNIHLTQDGHNITIATSLTPTFTTVNTTNLNVKNGGNIDVGNNQIHNVATGTAPTDAVNLQQLNATKVGVFAGKNTTVTPIANTSTGGMDYTIDAEKSVVNATAQSNVTVTPTPDATNHTTAYSVDLTQATKNDIKQGIDANTTVNKGLNFAGDIGNFNRQLDTTTTVKGGAKGDVTTAKNIKVAASDGILQIDLAKNIDLGGDGDLKIGDSTLNNNGLTIKDGPSVLKNGINAGNHKITNVEPAELSANSKDAVNGSQLYSTNLNLTNLTNTVDGGFNITTAQTGTGVADRSSTEPVYLGETVKYTAGDNIHLTQEGHNITIATSLTPDFTTVNTTNLNVKNGGKIDAGDNQIHRVANGTAPTDAVNLQQLNTTKVGVFAGKNTTVTPIANTSTGGMDYTIDAEKSVVNATAQSNITVSPTKDKTNRTTTYSVDLTQATKNDIKQGVDANTTVNKGLNFAGDIGNFNRQLDTTTTVKGGAQGDVTKNKNIKVTASAGTLQIDLAKNIDLGNDGSIQVGRTTINATTFDAGNKKITNVEPAELSANSKDAVNGSQLHSTNLNLTNLTNTVDGGFNVTTAQTGTGVADSSNTVPVHLGETVKYTAGDNIHLTQEGHNITIATSLTPTFTTVNTTNLNVKNGGNIDVGNNQIHNVATGTAPTDAVNLQQLNATKVGVFEGKNTTVTPIANTSTGGMDYTIDAEKSVVNATAQSNVTVTPTTDATNHTTTYSVDLTQVTKNDIKQGIDANTTVNKGLNFAGNAGNSINKKLGDTLNIEGGLSDGSKASADNIHVASESGKLVVKIANSPTFSGSVKANGFDANGKKITHVATGTADTDAVNVSQLKNLTNASKTEVVAGRNANVTHTTGTNGQTIYTLNANSSSVSADDNSNITVNKGDLDANGNTDYKLDLTAKTKQDIQDGVQANITANKGRLYSGDTGTEVFRKLGEKLIVKGGVTETDKLTENNIGVVANGDDTLSIRLAKELKGLTSAVFGGSTTINGNGLSITDGPSVLKDGINAGDKKIANVANGTAPTDAVNLQQLNATKVGVFAGKNTTVTPITNTSTGGMDYTIDAEKSVVNATAQSNVAVTPTPDATNHTTTYSVDLTQATKDDIKQGVDANTTVNKGLNFAGDVGTFNHKLGQVTNVTGGATGDVTTAKNIKVTATPENGTLQIDLAKNIDLGNDGSLQVGDSTLNNNGLTIKDGPSVLKGGINAGNHKITNVEPAELSANSKDAVNGSQLHSTNLNLTNLTNKVDGGFNVTTAQTGTGVADSSDTVPVHLGETVKYTAGDNIHLTQEGHNITIATSLTPTFTTVNTTNLNVKNGGNIDVGNNQIHNVATGTADTDAVNVSQLKNLTNASKTEVVAGRNANVTQAVGTNGQTIYTVNANSSSVSADNNSNITVTKGDLDANGNTDYKLDLTAKTKQDIQDGVQANITANKGTLYGGDSGTDVSRKLGDKLIIKGGVTEDAKLSENNIGVVANGNDTLTVKLAKDLKELSSAVFGGTTTINGDGLSITGGPSVLKDGINAGDKKIANVANGTAPTDAVNLQQLNATKVGVFAGKNTTVTPIANTSTGGMDYTIDAEKSVVNATAQSNVTVTPTPDATNHTTTYSVDLTQATKDDIKKGVDANTTANLGLDFAGDTGKFNRKLGQVTNVTGGATGDVTTAKNIKVTAKDGTLQIDLAKNLNLGDDGDLKIGDSTLNNSGLTIKEGPSVTKDGINAGNKAINNVTSNLQPTYNQGDKVFDKDGKLVDVEPAVTKTQAAPSGEEIAKIHNNAATVGDVLNAGWNLQNNGEARDFVKPYDTVNFVNGGNTQAVVVTDDAGKVSNISVNVVGLPVQFTTKAGVPVAKVGDAYYQVGEDGKPNLKQKVNAADLVTNLINPSAKPNVKGEPITLGNVKSSVADKDGDKYLDKLSNANKTNPNHAVNVADLSNTINALTDPTLGGGFGLKDENDKEVKQSLGKTIKVIGDGSVLTNVVEKDGKPALQISLNNTTVVGNETAPGTIIVKGENGKDGVSINGKDGTIGLNGKDGTSANITVGKGPNNLEGTNITRIVYDNHTVATLEDGLKFKGDNDEVINRPLNSQLNITGGAEGDVAEKNIKVTSNKTTGEIKVELAKHLNLTANGNISIGNTTLDGNGLTIKDGPSVTKDGINAGNKKITGVVGNLAPTYNKGDKVIGADGLPTETDGSEVTKSQQAPLPADVAKVYNNAATVGDVLNAGWNLKNNGEARDFVKPYDTVNFVNGGNTQAVVVTDEAGKVSNISVNVVGLPVQFTTKDGVPVAKVGDAYYKVDKDGKPDLAQKIEAPDLVTNLIDPTAKPNEKSQPVTLGNVKSSVADNAGKTYLDKLNNATSNGNGNNAVNVADLSNTINALTNPTLGGGFGLKDDNDKEVKQSLGETIPVIGDGSVLTNVVKGKDGKPALQIGLNSTTVVGNATAPGTIIVKGENGKDGVSINGKDGTIGLNGKDGTSANITVGKGPNNLEGTNITRIVYDNHTVATLEDGLKFKGDNDEVINRPLNSQLNITGGAKGEVAKDNIKVTSNATTGEIKVELAQQLNLTANGNISIGNTTLDGKGLTIKDGPSITKDGINAGNKAITNVTSNLKPTYNQGDKVFDKDGKLVDVQPAVTKTQAAPSGEEIAKIHNNAATVGDVLNAGWNLQNNGQARDFVKPYDTVNFVNGGNTQAVVVTDDAGKVSNISVNVVGLPVQFTTKDGVPVAKVGDNYYQVNEQGKPDLAKVVKPEELVTNLINPSAKPNVKGEPITLGNVKSSVADNAGKTYLDKLNNATSNGNGNNAVNVADLSNTINALTDPTLGGGFGLKDDNDKEVKESLGKTIKVIGDGSVLTKVVEKDGKPALQIGLNSTTVVGNATAPGTIIVKGENGKDGVSINGKDGTIGLNGKDGTNATFTVAQGAKGLDGNDGKDGESKTRIIYTKPNGGIEEVATLKDGLKFKGDNGEVINRPLNSQLNITGGAKGEVAKDNIKVTSNATTGEIKIELAKDINLTKDGSVTIGDTKVSDNGVEIKNGPSITKNGINASNKTITHVAPAELSATSKDAVNGSQLYATNQNISKIQDTINGGFNVTTAATGSGQVTDSSVKNVALGDTVKYTAGNNIHITQEGHNITVATNDNVSFTNVNASKVVVGNPADAANSTTLTSGKDGLDVGGDKITNVADGDISPTSKEVINGSQLSKVITNGFGLEDNNGKEVKQKLGETISVIGDGSVLTNVVKGKDDKPALQISLNSTTTVGTDEKPGTIVVKGENGKDGVSINGKDGTIGLNGKDGVSANIAVANGQKGLDGNDGKDGESKTRIVYVKPNGEKEEVATLKDGLIFVGDNKEVENKQALNTKVNIVGGADKTKLSENNIGVVADGNNTLAVKLAKDINLTKEGSVTLGNTSLTGQGLVITGESPEKSIRVTQDGINAGGKVISNVAPGKAPGDAVNYSQLRNVQNHVNRNSIAINRLGNQVNKIDKNLKAGIASVAAMANIPQVLREGKSGVGVGVGTRSGQQALAVGYSRASDNGHHIIKLSGAYDSQHNFTGGAGYTYQW